MEEDLLRALKQLDYAVAQNKQLESRFQEQGKSAAGGGLAWYHGRK